MFKNYLKIAFRNIKKHKGYSFINIAGLAIGMACCILMVVYISSELSFDRYHEKKMGAIESVDLENWTDISDSISFPPGTRHGTVFKVNRDLLDNIQANYTDNPSGVNDPQ